MLLIDCHFNSSHDNQVGSHVGLVGFLLNLNNQNSENWPKFMDNILTHWISVCFYTGICRICESFLQTNGYSTYGSYFSEIAHVSMLMVFFYQSFTGLQSGFSHLSIYWQWGCSPESPCFGSGFIGEYPHHQWIKSPIVRL